MNGAVVITGGSSGIGRALAEAAGRSGRHLFIVGRSPEKLQSACDELARVCKVDGLAIDVRSSRAGKALLQALSAKSLYCEVLVNCAGAIAFGPAATVSREDQLQVVDTNVRALTELSLSVLPQISKIENGGILNVGSILSYTTSPSLAVYQASKAYVRTFTSALRIERASKQMKISCLSPGIVKTSFIEDLPVRHLRTFQFLPKSQPLSTGAYAWRAFCKDRSLIVPNPLDRILTFGLKLLPASLVPKLDRQPPLTRGQDHAAFRTRVAPAIVITGAASGIGREFARETPNAGRDLVLIDQNLAGLQSLAQELQVHGRQTHLIQTDLRQHNCAETIAAALDDLGLFCEVLVNSAGVATFGLASELPREAQLDMVDVNIRALTSLSLAFLPEMVRRGKGGIINVGSIAAYSSGYKMAVYHATKAYVQSFSAALNEELAGSGVTVTCVSPGFVRTPLLDGLRIEGEFMLNMLPCSEPSRVAIAGWAAFQAGRTFAVPNPWDRLALAVMKVLPSALYPVLFG